MADPTIQTFCCHHSNNSDLAVRIMDEFNTDSYNIVCIVSSLFGCFGAIYQVYPLNKNEPTRILSYSSARGRRIITWLAVADLMASLGVLTRSGLWLRYKGIVPSLQDDTSVLFCAISSAWIQYFYTATWIWTLCYAIDMRFLLTEKPGQSLVYHLAAWSIPAVFTGTGLCMLYLPDARCHTNTNLRRALVRILPNYVATFAPISCVMVANPVLYRYSMKDMERMVRSRLGQCTSKERDIMDAIKKRFLRINGVFYFCWMPNLINGILLWAFWFRLPVRVIIALWYTMAITNPLQAFLNSFVYLRSGRKSNCCTIFRFYQKTKSKDVKLPSARDETLPLLQSVPRASINGFS